MNQHPLLQTLLDNDFFFIRDERLLMTNNKSKLKKHPDIFKKIVDATSYLAETASDTERVYHVLHNLTAPVGCAHCGVGIKFGYGYNNCCSYKCNQAWEKYSTVDGVNLAESRANKVRESNNKVDDVTGLTSYQTGALKGAQIRRETIDPVTGKSIQQLATERAHHTKWTTIDPASGKTLMALASEKLVATQRARVDPVTGLDKIQQATLKRVGYLKGIDIATGKTRYAGIFKKAVATKIATGHITPFHLRDEWQQYRMMVHEYTFANDLSKLKNFKRRGTYRNEKAYHLDHKFSVHEGFMQNVPPEIIGSIHNLEMIPWKQNLAKGKRCSVDLPTLINMYKQQPSVI